MFDFGVLNLGDLRACGYEKIIEGIEQNVSTYRIEFYRAAQVARENEEEQKANALNLLTAVCSLMLSPSNVRTPFSPYMVWGDRSSIGIDDFSKDYVKELSCLAQEIQDAELASRIADFVYVRLPNKKVGAVAVNKYIEASENNYCSSKWYERVKRLERAFHLAMRMKQSNLIKLVTEKMQKFLDPNQEQYYPFEAEKILNLFLNDKTIDREFIAEKAISLSEKIKNPERYEVRASFLDIADRAYTACGKNVQANEVRQKVAEYLLIKARNARKPDNMIAAEKFYGDAISKLQKCKNSKDKVDALKAEYSSAISAAEKEMKSFSVPLDVSGFVDIAIKAVRNKDKSSALQVFARLVGPFKKKSLEDSVIEQLKEHPLSFSGVTHIYSDNKLVGIVPALLGSEGEEYKIALASACYRYANIHISSIVAGAILPARDELLKCHSIDRMALEKELQHSAFIQDDRLAIWVKGFMAGFENDFDIALSILLPQFEHGLRKILESKGAAVWNIDVKTIICSEKSLNQLFDSDECRRFLGEDLHFLLKGLLIERIGFNARNDIAHGLMNEQQFYAPSSIYLWWLLFHLAIHVRCFDETTKTENVEQKQTEEAGS